MTRPKGSKNRKKYDMSKRGKTINKQMKVVTRRRKRVVPKVNEYLEGFNDGYNKALKR